MLTDSFIDTHAFELGGRRFELYSTPGGETTDALVVWMPEHRTVFIGNLMGPFFGHVPNLYTLRGDKIRSAMTFIHSLDRVIELRPETLINGHDVFSGADQILTTMTKVRDATAYLRDRTIDGMNSGADLWTLMRDVTLPRELALPQVHGKVAWIVRAIWEEHVGLVPLRVHHRALRRATVVGLVGRRRIWPAAPPRSPSGPPLMPKRGRPLQALHLTDIVLAHAPADPDALRVKRQALEQLLAASGRENHSEVQWLEQEINSATVEEDSMKAENLYHTGIVVDDIEATMDWFTKVAGYTWTDVVTVDQDAVTPDGEVTIPMKMVYSGAEPRLELLQTVPGTVWTPADSGVHHLGYWSDDVESDLATLESNGMAFEVKSYNPDGSGHAAVGLRQGPDRTAHRTRQPQHGTVHRLLVGVGDQYARADSLCPFRLT